MRWSVSVFDALLKLYPADFRDEYGREIVLVFADRYRAAAGPVERAGVWLEAVAGVIQEAPKEHLRMFWQDLRYAARALRANPLFAGTVVLALALGIGANSAIFSVMNAVVLRSLPVPNPEELYLLREEPGAALPQRVSWPMFERMRQAAPGHVAAMTRGVATLHARIGGAAQADPLSAHLVSGEYFKVLGVSAARGRMLTPDDNLTPGAHPVAVISYGCWQRRFSGSPDAIGRQLTLNGAHFTIVGVAEQAFTGVWLESPTEVWLPLAMQHDVRYSQNYSASDAQTTRPWMPQNRILWLWVLARAPGGAAAAQAPLNTAYQQTRAAQAESIGDPEERRRFLQTRIALVPFAHGISRLRERFTEPLYVLMAMAGLVLLIACANTANLLLARATARQKEIALRLSLGAGRIRLFRQLLTEGLLLVSIAAAAALAIARWTADALVRMATATAAGPAPFAAGIEWRVLAFTASVALATALLFGLLPAIRAARVDPAAALKSGARSIAGGSGRTPRVLVAVQMALSLVLVVGAGLLVRSVRNALETPLGFEREHLLSVAIDPRLAGYRADRLPALYERLRERIGALPGVRSVALAQCGILSGCRSAEGGLLIEGHQGRPADVTVVNNVVTPGYFQAVGMRLRAGRPLEERDRKDTPLVAVVNEAFMRRYAGGAPPLGRKFGQDAMNQEIVGVVEDARVLDVKTEPVPMAYFPLQQRGEGTPRSIEIRAEGDPRQIAAAVRKAIAGVEPRLPIEGVTTMSERVRSNLTQDRLLLSLFSAFGGLALGLAGFGLFGLLSYAVARRKEEFGIRMALGAPRAAVLWTVVRESLLLSCAGLAAGLPLVIAGTKFMRSVLFGVSPWDGVTIGAAAALLVAVAAVAGLLPAWRASRVDPVTALRSE